jgi:peroxiredoxin
MSHLQKFYTKYQDKNVVVLGFNPSDDKEIALQMLRDNGVTFPNIIDSSEAAQKVCFQEYQRGDGSAVPMSYIIDPDGKVAAAWYGYEEGHPKAKAVLEKFSIAERLQEVQKELSKDDVNTPPPQTDPKN